MIEVLIMASSRLLRGFSGGEAESWTQKFEYLVPAGELKREKQCVFNLFDIACARVSSLEKVGQTLFPNQRTG
jgi:hypothetical protein